MIFKWSVNMRIIKSVLLSLSLFAALFASGCTVQGKSGGVNTVEPAPSNPAGVEQSLMNLNLEILKINYRKGANAFISPLSVALALAMTANGAGGETLGEFRTLLGGDMQSINNYYTTLSASMADSQDAVVQIANGIFMDEKAKTTTSFTDAVKSYNAEFRSLDFTANKSVDEINNWVAKKTNGLIKTIIDSLSPLDRLVLVNTLYFYGDWQLPFDTNRTTEDKFFPEKGNPVSATFMRLSGRFPTYSDANLDALFLPYKGGRYEMALLMPKESRDIPYALSIADSDYIRKIGEERSPEQVALSMLKFESDGKYVLNNTLQKMGLKKAFEEKADFSAMSGTKPLFISQVMHKTRISITEAGTEAAAATAITMRTTSIRAPERVMEFNRPFIYYIWDTRTKQMLFAGIMENPKK